MDAWREAYVMIDWWGHSDWVQAIRVKGVTDMHAVNLDTLRTDYTEEL